MPNEDDMKKTIQDIRQNQDGPELPSPDDLDGMDLDQMADAVDQASEGLDDPEMDELEPEIETVRTAPVIDSDALGALLGAIIIGAVNRGYEKLNWPGLSPSEAIEIQSKTGPVVDRYLPTLDTEHPELFGLAGAVLGPAVLRYVMILNSPKVQPKPQIQPEQMDQDEDQAPNEPT